MFSLVERFTFKPSSTETDLPNPPPRLPPEIQYWAGVIMRNACRKDDSRGGIRQCANSEFCPFFPLPFVIFCCKNTTLNYLRQCSVDDGRPTHANLRNAEGAGRPSIVARNVRVRRGARDTGFGVVRRMWMRMLLLNGNRNGVNIYHHLNNNNHNNLGYKSRSLERGMLLMFLLDGGRGPRGREGRGGRGCRG